MSIFKRLTATISSRIDQVVGEIENHDAVIQASMGDIRRKVSEAKVRLNRVNQEAARLRDRHRAKRQEVQRWQARAVQSAEAGDEAKALQCVQRGRQCQDQADRLEQASEVYAESSSRLAQDIAGSEERLVELKHKHTLMQARESSTQARAATSPEENTDLQQLEEVFDRWEIRLGAVDSEFRAVEDPDLLEREFVDQEQQQSLRNELAQLMNKGESA